MQRIPFASQTSALDSQPATLERTLNVYAEKAPEQARTPYLLRSTPGLLAAATCGAGYIRAMECVGARMLVVSGDQLWQWVVGQVSPTMLGNVGTGGPVTIAFGAISAVVCTPPRAFVYRYDNSGLTEIPQGGTNPFTGASSVCWLDGYFVFTRPDSGEFFVSELDDPLSFDALHVATAEAVPDLVFRAMAHANELWLFGATTVEVWADIGDAQFPFQRVAGGVIPGGTAAPASVAEVDHSLFWLQPDGIVCRTEGRQPKRVSSTALERAMVGYPTWGDAIGFGMAHDGHRFYALTFPTAPGGGATWCYDAATGLWHERATGAGGTGRWVGNASAMLANRSLVGSGSDGTIYQQNKGVGTEGDATITRRAVLPPLWADTKRATMHRLELEMEAGDPGGAGTVALDWSDDGGFAWSNPRTLNAGNPGDRRARAVATRLGMFRQRTLRLTATGHCNLYACDAEIEGGAN